MTTAAFTFDPTTFRQQFPAFASETDFPDAQLQMYFDMGGCYAGNERGGCLTDECRILLLNLMTAHLCLLNQLIITGKTPGITTSSSVGSVSVSITPPPFGTSQWSWWLNLTAYGQQFQALLSGQVAGGLYLGGRCERGAFRKVGGAF